MNALDVRKEGYLRRLKTQKRRYFVLRTTSPCGQPRLEYYESEKKFRTSCPPKRVIHLCSCFNITQKDDTKHDYVFALYTREDVFGLICESKDELQSWLDALLNEHVLSASSQGNDYLSEKLGDLQLPELRQDYTAPISHESSWPVTVKPRGLGTSKNLAGTYNLKLADHTLSLHKISNDILVANFHLTIVRRCGHTDCFFFMEVGRSSMIGAGELWMQVDDPILAKNLHEVVLMSMQTLSSDGYSSLSRVRCQSGGNKPRPTSLLLITPPRTRSDTLPDTLSSGEEGPPSPVKPQTPEQSSPSGSKRTAMFQRLRLVGKRKSEDFSPKLFSRRFQSKSLSIDPNPRVLGRAQSMDFSNLIGTLPSSPESPEEERDIGFDIEEPLRTSSNSSGSSIRSWDHSLPRNINSTYIYEQPDTNTMVSSTRPSDIHLADEGYDSTARDDNTPDGPPTLDDNHDGTDKTTTDENPLEGEIDESQEDTDAEKRQTTDDDTGGAKNVGMSQRNRSGYEDMTGNLSKRIERPSEEHEYENVQRGSNANSLERETANSPSMQRRTSEPVRSDSPLMMEKLLSKSSPKQRRTSEPMATTSYEFRELVTFKNSPSSSPRRNKNGTSANGTIMEYPDSPPENSSPPDSPKDRRHERYSDEYVEMNVFGKSHYVNLNPKESFKPEEEPTYMNFRAGSNPGSQTESDEHGYMNYRAGSNLGSQTESEEHDYMNFRPGSYQATQTESEGHDYMNYKPGQFDVDTVEEEPSYVNIQPGSVPRSDTKSPRQKPKHTYENLRLNGTPKGGSESEQFSGYMNVSPQRHISDKSHFKRKSLPHKGNIFPNLHRRRESEPVNLGLKGMSDEENGMLFLDFSNNKSTSSKGLNYIMVNHISKDERSPKGSPKNRPPDINTSLTSRSFDVGPKSAPLSTSSYAEIDFARSHGLRQAIIEHKKPKTPKE